MEQQIEKNEQKFWQINAGAHIVGTLALAIAFSYLMLTTKSITKCHYILSFLSGAFAASMWNFLKKDFPYYKNSKYINLIFSSIFKFFAGYLLIWVTFKITNDFPQDKLVFISYCSFWFWLANIITSEIINYHTKKKCNTIIFNEEEKSFLINLLNQNQQINQNQQNIDIRKIINKLNQK